MHYYYIIICIPLLTPEFVFLLIYVAKTVYQNKRLPVTKMSLVPHLVKWPRNKRFPLKLRSKSDGFQHK